MGSARSVGGCHHGCVNRRQPPPGSPLLLDLVDRPAPEDSAELWPVYDAVFADQPDQATWRETVWDRHTARDGFRLVRAYVAGRLVGFAYGYTGQHGQWWTDRAAEVLPPEVARDWLGGHFELVSIGVLDEVRGAGIGRAVLRAVTDGLPQDRWLLMTARDADDPAHRLYLSEGWRVLGPGLADDRVIMGRRP